VTKPSRKYAGLSTTSESGDANANPFAEQSDQDFVVPTPLRCSNVDEPSPSLYRKVRAEEAANKSFDEKLEIDYEEGAKMCEIEEVEESQLLRPKLMPPIKMLSYSMSLANSQKVLKDMCKKELMESPSKSTRHLVNFDALQLPSRGSRMQFTPR
jgi:hypothetical protein